MGSPGLRRDRHARRGVAAAAEQVAALRVMLHPFAAARGALPPDARATLEALAGTVLTLTGTTRTGALELALPAPVPEAEAIGHGEGIARRSQRAVGGADPDTGTGPQIVRR